MISRFCTTLFSSTVAATATVNLAASKDLNFVRKTLYLIPVSNRCNISTNADAGYSFTVSCLISSCGSSPKSALSDSKEVQLKTSKTPDSVISFLKNQGFSQAQIVNVSKKCPWLLSCDVDSILRPKFEFFYSKGLDGSELVKLLNSVPYILRLSLQPCIIQNFNSLKNLTGAEDKKVLYALALCGNRIYCYDHLLSNFRLLQENGVPDSYTVPVVLSRPSFFMVKHDIFKAVVEEVKKMGFNPSRYAFVDAVRIFLIKNMNKSLWERKFGVYKKWGWSDEEIWYAFRKKPKLMLLSDRNINAKLAFFINKMGSKSQYFANHPHLLLHSLEKRIIPRCSVLQYLMSKGLIKEDYNIRMMLTDNEKQFLQKFLAPYEDPHLWKLYEEKLSKSK